MHLILLFSSIIFVLFPTFSFSQPYKYLSNSELESSLKEIASGHSATVVIKEIGKSAGGHTLHAVEIGTGEKNEKPALLVIAGVEPDDLASTVAATEFIRSLTADSLKSLLERVTVYIIPRLSPDAADGYFSTPKFSLQGNAQADDADRDGAIDEDGAQDINNDGQVTSMRIIDPSGEWMINPDDSSLMKKADKRKGEVGQYRLISEGKDDDRDGKVNEDEVGGTNINRNFTFKYKPYQTDGGEYPFSSPEARALGEFLFTHNNILTVFTFEYHDNISETWKISTPEQQSGNNFASDSASYSQIASILKKHLRFTAKSEPPSGDIAQWAYYHGGRISYCAPAWIHPAIVIDTSKETSKKADEKKSSIDPEMRALKWIQKFTPANFIPWKRYEHPDFSGMNVEIGGFAPFALRNPPPDSLGSVAITSNNLLQRLAEMMPILSVIPPKVESIGNDVFRITVSISNTGIFPTHTIAGRQVKGIRPLQSKAEIAPGQKVLSGRAIQLFPDPLVSGATVQHIFLVSGRGDIRFTVGCPTAGFVKVSASAK
ncbi:MAG: hypothetical protein HYZ54_09925 [Ignavibacteriae bacterium]|nr:hypothetical protein [Ignavibacteriota bacterium]